MEPSISESFSPAVDKYIIAILSTVLLGDPFYYCHPTFIFLVHHNAKVMFVRIYYTHTNIQLWPTLVVIESIDKKERFMFLFYYFSAKNFIYWQFNAFKKCDQSERINCILETLLFIIVIFLTPREDIMLIFHNSPLADTFNYLHIFNIHFINNLYYSFIKFSLLLESLETTRC